VIPIAKMAAPNPKVHDH